MRRGYHKPIMIAGGLGTIDAGLTHKIEFPAGTLLVQLGGPGMRIGMGGGAASSMAAGANAAELDFDSVQRGNPEIERRAQEVINHCWALGAGNPVLAIHDVGAGGLSNAFPELVNDAGRGARFDLAQGAAGGSGPGAEGDLVQREPGALRDGDRAGVAGAVRGLCERERCPFAVVGVATDRRRAPRLPSDGEGGKRRPTTTPAIDMPMDVLLGKPPKMHRDVKRVARDAAAAGRDRRRPAGRGDRRAGAIRPSPPSASSSRSATARSAASRTATRWSGPWQVPVADCAVTLADYKGFAGEAMSMGERTPLAAIDAPASGRMAVAEAITNLLAAPIELPRVKLSANWMAPAASRRGRRAVRHGARRRHGAVPALGVSIPVGKDSLSMRTQWSEGGQAKKVTSPVSLIVTALRQHGRRARHAHAAAAGRRHHAGPGGPGAGATAWAAASWRRCWASSAARCPTWTIRRTW